MTPQKPSHTPDADAIHDHRSWHPPALAADRRQSRRALAARRAQLSGSREWPVDHRDAALGPTKWPKCIQTSRRPGTTLAHGVVDMSKSGDDHCPDAGGPECRILYWLPRRAGSTQRQAYNDRVRKNLPTPIPGVQTTHQQAVYALASLRRRWPQSTGRQAIRRTQQHTGGRRDRRRRHRDRSKLYYGGDR